MKGAIGLLVALFMAALVGGCDQPFSPKTDFRNLPVLQSIVSANFKSIPRTVVLLGTTYDVLGFNPDVNSDDPTVVGALISVRIKNTQYYLYEASRKRTDTTRYSTRLHYYANDTIRINPGDSITVTAVLPDGESVWATARMPRRIFYETNYDLSAGLSTYINTYDYGPVYEFTWNETHGERHIYFPKITLLYEKKVNDTTRLTLTEEVPMRIVTNGGQKEPLYAKYTYDPQLDYTFEAFDWTMRKIGGDVIKKSDITVLGFSFTIVEFDVHLSRYYASTNGYLDSYSVRLDETVYSNIQGGIGIFGASYQNLYDIPIDPSYARKFGYRAP